MSPRAPVLDPARTVRTDVNRVLWAEEIPQNVHVSGHVYDVDTGLVTTVVDAKARKVRRRSATAGLGARGLAGRGGWLQTCVGEA
jgi:hypothetical protein